MEVGKKDNVNIIGDDVKGSQFGQQCFANWLVDAVVQFSQPGIYQYGLAGSFNYKGANIHLEFGLCIGWVLPPRFFFYVGKKIFPLKNHIAVRDRMNVKSSHFD